MSDEKVLAYLEKFVSSPTLLELEHLSSADRRTLPAWWVQVLSLPPAERAAATVAVWQQQAPDLEDVVSYLGTNLLSVRLLRRNDAYVLLYEVRTVKGRSIYYEGLDLAPRFKPAVAALWSRMPAALRTFYSQLHGGWYHLSSGAMGLMAADQLFPLSDEDWGILESLPDVSVRLETSIAVFTSGAGGYIVVELLDEGFASHVWFASDPPKLKVDFWPVIDSWIVMGFDDA